MENITKIKCIGAIMCILRFASIYTIYFRNVNLEEWFKNLKVSNITVIISKLKFILSHCGPSVINQMYKKGLFNNPAIANVIVSVLEERNLETYPELRLFIREHQNRAGK